MLIVTDFDNSVGVDVDVVGAALDEAAMPVVALPYDSDRPFVVNRVVRSR